MVLNAIYDEKSKKFVGGMISMTSDTVMPVEDHQTIKIYEVGDPNFIPYKNVFNESAEDMHEFAEMVKLRMKELDSPIIMIDVDKNQAYILNNIDAKENTTELNYSSLNIDQQSFPNGVNDILNIIHM